MNFFGILFLWLVIAAVMATGVVMATNGSFALLVISLLGFVFAFSKWGCASH